MIRYLVRRILLALPLVLGIVTILFFVINLAPGDPTQVMVRPGMRPEVIAQMRANFGLDQPLPVRYVKWLGALAQGDFGYSFSHGRPVVDVIGQMLPNTLLLSSAAFLVAFLAGILIGIVQAVRQYSLADQELTVLALFFYSMPSFWLALMLIPTFALFARNVWEWPIYFPPSGTRSVDWAQLGTWDRMVDRARHMVLSVAALSLVLAAGIARYTRGSMLEVIRQDFVRTARGQKGCRSGASSSSTHSGTRSSR